jgi:hypothetical protein
MKTLIRIRDFLFGEKHTPLIDILGNDGVKRVIDDFTKERMAKSDGVIIIWTERGHTYLDNSPGLGESNAIGSLHLMGHLIEHEGLPRQ